MGRLEVGDTMAVCLGWLVSGRGGVVLASRVRWPWWSFLWRRSGCDVRVVGHEAGTLELIIDLV